MSHDHLRSAVSELAQMAAAGFAHAKLGWVSSYDPDNYLVKVLLQPEGTETGWLPIVTGMSGAGFGVYYGPHADPSAGGDQALIVFQEGDASSGICVGFLPSDVEQPPNVKTGEIHLIAKGATASVVMKPDGTITSVGTWVHTGSFEVDGAAHVTGAATLDSTLAVTGKTTAAEIDSGGPIKVGGVTVSVP